MRSQQGFADPTPTLVDIERTHILYVNAHFKPFAAVGFEYNKVRNGTGTPVFGGSVQFSIPQFGDFISDMVVNVQLDSVAASAGTVPDFPAFIGPDDHDVSDPAKKVSGKQSALTGIYTKYTHEYVDVAGNVLLPGATAVNFVRYCEYPGQRLFKAVKFEVNGNPLDEYRAETYLFHQKYHVGPHKLTGWKRLVGQEVPIDAVSEKLAIFGSSNWGSAAVNLSDQNGGNAAGSPELSLVTARRLTRVLDGPQTPKFEQPAQDWWIPLLFWFNKDARLSIASVAIPYGQRFITIELEAQNRIVFTAPGNLFLKLTTELQYSNHATKGTAAALQVYNVKKYVTLTPTLANGSSVITTQSIRNMELYINNIFVNPEIHDIYIKRIGFSLIRVHRYQNNRVNLATADTHLNNLKWPVETMYVGVRPAWNVDAANVNQYRDWHHLSYLEDNVIDITSHADGDVMINDGDAFNAPLVGAVAYTHKKFSSQELSERLVYANELPTIDSLLLQAHGIAIFNDFKAAFFRDYTPYTYGGTNIQTPEDTGAMMLNFCLYPGTYQPSGHMNLSRAREFYLQYKSSFVDAQNPADLIVDARAINFILISDGSAVLRYST
jgi:hypothetical protein